MIVIKLAFWLGFTFLYAVLFTWLSRSVFRVLPVPDEFIAEKKRDRTMTFIFYLSPPLASLFFAGPVLLLCTYFTGIRRHFRDSGPTHPFAVPRLPRIPRFALSELLVMVFSIATFPLLCGGGWLEGAARAAILIYAILEFPLCFASAFLKLDANKVPLGKARFAFLFLYPYYLTAWPVLLITGLYEFWFFVFSFGLQYDHNNFILCISIQSVALLVIVLTCLAARQAKRDAEAASAAAKTRAAQAAYGAQVELTPPADGVGMAP